MLHLGRLQALCEVASRGTIAAAADALHLTPSAVSQQLSALEREVGEPLVEPDGRSVRLTPVARVLVRRADEIFAQVESLHSELAEHAGGERADLRLGSFSTGITNLVAPLVRRLRESSPGISLEVTESEMPEALDALGRHELDLLITMEHPGAPRPEDPRFTRAELAADPLLTILPADHAKA